jgi:hypothetical protein
MSGEAFVSISVATSRDQRIGVSLYPDAATRFEAKVLGSGAPLLQIGQGDIEVSIWPHVPDEITDADIETARRLVQAATTYLTDCERIHAEQTDAAA